MSSALAVVKLLALLPAVVLATDFTHWRPPLPTDVRSPCPGLNSLANHGILPRNGRGITLDMLNSALIAGFNSGPDFNYAIGSAGLLSVPNNPLATSFDLDNLDEHNFPIEHDASLSRADYYLDRGDNYSFNYTIWDTVLAYYNGMKTTSIPVAGAAKYNRVNTERNRDAHFTYGPQQFILSYGETALYLSVMGDPITGVAPVDWVRIFFEEERLPYLEGWRPRNTSTTLFTLGEMIIKLNAATGEELPEGLLITNQTVRMAFQGYNPVTGLLNHAT